MFAAQMRTTTIKFHVTFRKAYGFGGCIMGLLGFTGNSRSYAFPGATMGAMPARGSSKATHADEDTTSLLAQAELESSYKAAQGLTFDDLIDRASCATCCSKACRSRPKADHPTRNPWLASASCREPPRCCAGSCAPTGARAPRR